MDVAEEAGVCVCVCIDACTNMPLHCLSFHDVHYLPSKLLLLHVVPCCPSHVKGTPEVNSLDKVWKTMCTTVCSIIMTTYVQSCISCISIFQVWTIGQVRVHRYLGLIPLYPLLLKQNLTPIQLAQSAKRSVPQNPGLRE